eukprot:48871_1
MYSLLRNSGFKHGHNIKRTFCSSSDSGNFYAFWKHFISLTDDETTQYLNEVMLDDFPQIVDYWTELNQMTSTEMNQHALATYSTTPFQFMDHPNVFKKYLMYLKIDEPPDEESFKLRSRCYEAKMQFLSKLHRVDSNGEDYGAQLIELMKDYREHAMRTDVNMHQYFTACKWTIANINGKVSTSESCLFGLVQTIKDELPNAVSAMHHTKPLNILHVGCEFGYLGHALLCNAESESDHDVSTDIKWREFCQNYEGHIVLDGIDMLKGEREEWMKYYSEFHYFDVCSHKDVMEFVEGSKKYDVIVSNDVLLNAVISGNPGVDTFDSLITHCLKDGGHLFITMPTENAIKYAPFYKGWIESCLVDVEVVRFNHLELDNVESVQDIDGY